MALLIRIPENLINQQAIPAYCLDVNELDSNLKDFNTAFRSKFEKFQLAYSFKTNPIPWLCKWLHDQGALIEVVSGMEYALVRSFGISGSDIIFNGPSKSCMEIQTALVDGAVVNLDSLQEVDYVLELQESGVFKTLGSSPRLGLRLNVWNPSQQTVSRFGLSVRDGEAQKAVDILRKTNLKIVSLHGHRTTRNRNTQEFQNIVHDLAYFAATHLAANDLKVLNIGGGFGRSVAGMDMPEFPSVKEYANAISQAFYSDYPNEPRPILQIEPGLSLVGSAFQLLCRVKATKIINGSHYAFLDASFHNLKPSLHSINLPIKIYGPDGQQKSGPPTCINFVGFTCMEFDQLGQYNSLPPVETGDIVVFDNVGAYTMALNPQFIRERPPVYTVHNQEIELIRRKENLADILAPYNIGSAT